MRILIRFFSVMVFTLLASAPVMGDSASSPHVMLQTSKGDIELVLYPAKAPATVKNFLHYVDSGFYDGTVFHRVIPGFVIQGGGYNQQFRKKKTRAPIPNEADNGLHNKRGTIAMARTSDPDSATSQFFINLNDNPNLDAGVQGAGYAVFGKVVNGMEVVENIAGAHTGSGGPFEKDVPQHAVVIKKAKQLQENG